MNKIRSIAYTQGITPTAIIPERTPVMPVIEKPNNFWRSYKTPWNDNTRHGIEKRQRRDEERRQAKAAEVRLNELAWREMDDIA